MRSTACVWFWTCVFDIAPPFWAPKSCEISRGSTHSTHPPSRSHSLAFSHHLIRSDAVVVAYVETRKLHPCVQKPRSAVKRLSSTSKLEEVEAAQRRAAGAFAHLV